MSAEADREARDPAAEADQLLVVRRDGDVLRVTLDHPDKANALAPRLLAELTALYRRRLRDEGLRAVILDARGKHFSAGADLEHLKSLQTATAEDNLVDSRRLRNLFEAVLRQEVLTVALVHGAAIAGGCGLATAHDFVIASDDAKLMYSEVRIGFVAALVATFLPLRVRGSHLRELLLDPELLDASRALEIGLVDRVVPRSELQAAGDELVDRILSKAAGSSIALTKRLLLDVLGRPLDDAFHRAARVNAASRATDDCRRGIAHFLEHKSTPDWRQAPDGDASDR